MVESRVRVGYGYDVHRLEPGRPMKLGGVEIPFDKGPVGHSDADVLLHAIIDAVLGAAALGDIGTHFPDTDAAFKDANSRTMMTKVKHMVDAAGYSVDNVDATVVVEKPRLAPFITSMRTNIASDLGITVDQVSVKATTSESLGFVGQGSGIVAHAVCLIRTAG